jgi:hypothetical protein
MIAELPPATLQDPGAPPQSASVMQGVFRFVEQRNRLAGVHRISLGVPEVAPVPAEFTANVPPMLSSTS